MLIRAEKECDRNSVHAVNVSAFETSSEADLVDALRQQARPVVSLVAEENGEVVGHIMFSPVSLSNHPDFKVMGLAPMAVLTAHQRAGFGSALVRAGLEQCRQLTANGQDCAITSLRSIAKFPQRSIRLPREDCCTNSLGVRPLCLVSKQFRFN